MAPRQDFGFIDMELPVDFGRADMPPVLDQSPDMVSPPDMMRVDMAPVFDMSVPDMEQPDMTAPDMSIPDMTMPDMNVPDMNVPDMNTPDMAPVDMGQPMIGPQIVISPQGQLNFGNNPVGAMVDVTLNVSNVGDAPLTVTSADLRARPSQGFEFAPVVSTPTIVQPGQTRSFVVTFKPQAAAGYRNFIDVKSDDADDATVSLELVGRGFATTTRACLYSSPDVVDFGIVAPGSSATREVTVGNCSTTEVVTVTQLRLGSMNPNAPYTFTSSKPVPFAIPVGGVEKVTVKYAPATNVDTQDSLQIRSDSQVSPVSTVQLVGSGGGCPEMVARGESTNDALAVDALRQGTIVTRLGDTVVLNGAESAAPSGQLLPTWRMVQRPAGSVAGIVNPSALDTSFVPDKAGVYLFELDGKDLVTNNSACAVSTLEVVVLGEDPQVKVEVTWNADHDVDLHVQRNVGMGWPMLGDMTNDLFYDHVNADWGMVNNPLDNAFHFGDDPDGLGPEAAILTKLESGRSYRVIAQFARRDGFQPFRFTVTTKITVFDPATNMSSLTQLTHDFEVPQQGRSWVAARIDGTTGAVTIVDMVF